MSFHKSDAIEEADVSGLEQRVIDLENLRTVVTWEDNGSYTFASEGYFTSLFMERTRELRITVNSDVILSITNTSHSKEYADINIAYLLEGSTIGLSGSSPFYTGTCIASSGDSYKYEYLIANSYCLTCRYYNPVGGGNRTCILPAGVYSIYVPASS